MSFFSHVARMYMSMKECLVPAQPKEAQEEIVADLYSCLEQLHDRSVEMETRIETCAKQMVIHAHASQSSQKLSQSERIREQHLAKQCLQNKKRIQVELDKTRNNIQLIQHQIDIIVSSQLNMVVVDTMKQFNFNAARMSLPLKTMEIENLESHLAERTREVTDLQEAMNNVSQACIQPVIEDDQELWTEIELYMKNDDVIQGPLKTPIYKLHDLRPASGKEIVNENESSDPQQAYTTYTQDKDEISGNYVLKEKQLSNYKDNEMLESTLHPKEIDQHKSKTLIEELN